MTIRSFLSGGHLSSDTRAWLDARTSKDRVRVTRARAQAVLTGCVGDGWFVYADEAPCQAVVPADLAAAFRYARRHGCELLLFDCDVIPMEDLPVLHPDFEVGP